jgi:RNA polymerase sigma-70 factor (ECF subfamily)
VALSVVNDVMAAEDVSQDAMIYAVEHINDCRHPGKFGAWLRQIVRSHARNHVRHPASARALGLEAIGPRSDGTDPDRDVERSELRERLITALRQVPEIRREVVLLHDMEGWTHEEIGSLMNLPAGTVRSHLHHARRKLRELLAGSRGE